MLRTMDHVGPHHHLVAPPRPGWSPGPGLMCAFWTAALAGVVAFWVTVALFLSRV
jgi:hypothetical protein